jgi:hypothetical protein
MAIGNRQIGWSQESNLLWSISSQIQRLISVVSKSLAPKYKVYTALLTQSGGDDPQYQQLGSLVVGRTYEIADNGVIDWDFTNVGAPNNEIGTLFVATGTTPANWGQNGNLNFNTGAPVVTVLENTIGNIWFNYDAPGTYNIFSDDLFIDTKTTVNMFPAQFIESPVDIYNSTAIPVNVGRIALLSYYNYLAADNALSYGGPTMIEIRVYN